MEHQNLSATAKDCKCCRETSENLKSDFSKGNIGPAWKPREENTIVQLDIWSPVVIACVFEELSVASFPPIFKKKQYHVSRLLTAVVTIETWLFRPLM